MVYINVLGPLDVAGASVQVTNSSGQTVFTGTTNAQFYVYVELPEGTFTATASKTGYITQQKTFKGTDTSIGFNMVKESANGNGTSPGIPTITWIAIGVTSLAVIIGAALYLKRKH